MELYASFIYVVHEVSTEPRNIARFHRKPKMYGIGRTIRHVLRSAIRRAF